MTSVTRVFYALGFIFLFSLKLSAQHDITINISAETETGSDDGSISLIINDVFSEQDNPSGINTPPFSFVWSYNDQVISEDDYDFDEQLGTCFLENLTPGEYCVNIIKGVGSEFECSTEGCFIVEALEEGEFNVTIDAPEIGSVDQPVIVEANGGNNGGGQIDWDWNFSGANILSSNEQTQEIFYSVPGLKTITLNASNEEGQSDVATHQIEITNDLAVDFNFTQTSFSPSGLGFTSFFEAEVTGAMGNLKYDWSFGDGSSISDLVIDFTPHNYQNTGTYPVTLTVTDLFGMTSITKNIHVISNEFSVEIITPASTQFISAGETVDFVAQANNPVGQYNYTWFFGDGGSSDPIPSNQISHTYNQPGCKTVTVWATDAGGTVSNSYPCLVQVDFLSFQIDGVGISDDCTLETLTLTAHASGGQTYDWDDDFCGLIDNKRYKTYVWSAKTIENDQIIQNIFTDPLDPCTQLNLNHAFFSDLIGTGGEKSIKVSVQITDNSPIPEVHDYETILRLYDDIVLENSTISACPGTEIPLILDFPSSPALTSTLSYQWQGNTAAATAALSCLDCAVPMLNVLDGTFRYRVEVTASRWPQDCTYEAFFDVTGSSLLVNATINGDDELLACTGVQSAAQLGGIPTAGGGSGNYRYSWLPNLNISDPSSANPTVWGAAEGETQLYTLLVTDEYGCIETASVKVTGASSVLEADAGKDLSVCFDNEVIIEGEPTGVGYDSQGDLLQSVSYQWTDSENNNVGNMELLIIENANPLHSGIYTVQVIDPSNGCFSTDEMTLTVNSELIINGFAAEPIEVGCEGQVSGRAFADPPISLPAGYSFQWEPASVVDDPESLNPIIVPTFENPFSFLIITQKSTGCSIKKMSRIWALYENTPTIEVSNNPEDLCPNQEVCFTIMVDYNLNAEILEEHGLNAPNRMVSWYILDEFASIHEQGQYSFTINQANSTEICTTFGYNGTYTLMIDQLMNHCGTASLQMPFNIGGGGSNQVCDNNSSTNPYFVINGIYTAENLEIAPSFCNANILIGQSVSTIASENILISENFTAEKGSQFLARIDNIESCGDVMAISTRNTPLGITEMDIKKQLEIPDINIYPNPFTDLINLEIETDHLIEKLDITIQSMTNQNLFNTTKRNVDQYLLIPLPLDKLNTGIYWCKIVLDGEVYYHKMIKI